MIEYGAGVELAAGIRPEIFKSLCDHSGLSRAQLDHVARTEGIPTAIRYAVWKGEQRNRGRRMVEARRRLLSYRENT
jgi:hypothetical protein